jgi:hypothetical protein
MTDDAEHTKRPAEAAAEDAVPKLPRGRGIRLSRPELVRIAGMALLLVFLLVAQRPCANAVSTFVTGFGSSADSGDRGSAGVVMPRPGTAQPPGSSAASAGTAGSGSAAPNLDQYEHLRPGMTDEEIKAVIERARDKAAGRRPYP